MSLISSKSNKTTKTKKDASLTREAPAAEKTAPAVDPDSLKRVFKSAEAAIDKKAENVKILNVSGISGFTDFFLICSGTSDRQIQAIADSIEARMKKDLGVRALSIEGYSEGRWILLDFGDVVAHVFLDAIRDYYHLESLWEDAKSIPIPDEFLAPLAKQTPSTLP